jgi:hypothetical protein
VTVTPLGPPVPTPAEVRDSVRRLRDSVTRIDAWNDQMVAVAKVIVEATENGLGVIIGYSDDGNTIDAQPSAVVEVGSAVLINRDRDMPRPAFRTIRPEHLTRSTS